MWGSSWRCIQFGPHVSVNVAVVPELSRNEIDPSPLCFRRPDRGRSRLLFSMKTQASSATLRDRVRDDKCGVVMHAGALRAHDSQPPVGVTVFVEGEEEWGSPNLGKFLNEYGSELRADAVILADSGNWRTGQPGLTISLRGIVACDIEVRTLDHAVHSGEFGGPVPDALTVLAKTLATLHDERGNGAVAGIARGKADPLDLEEAELR